MVQRSFIINSLLRNNVLNLLGIGAAVLGLQISVGTLVAKTLAGGASGATGVVGSAAGVVNVSLDVFSLQALTNTLLSHFISLIFTNLMLRLVNKSLPPKQRIDRSGLPPNLGGGPVPGAM